MSQFTTADMGAASRSLAMIQTRTVVGVDAIPVIVEVHLANGLPAFSTVGLPETAVRESKDRVRGALLNSGFEFPARRITVNLSPADLPKNGSRFDLPIAIGILVASGQLPAATLSNYELIGELALGGQLRPVRGVLPTAIACAEQGRQLVVASQNAAEAALCGADNAWHGAHLLDVCAHFAGHGELQLCSSVAPSGETVVYPDLADVKGQQHAKRALEVSASGGHSLLLIGPPGTGKSMLAYRLPGLLPEMNTAEALQTAAIQSVANGEFDPKAWKQRPFRNPHHSASAVAMVGGGSTPRPGEISMAHNGILFLDELAEFSRLTLEQLREPLESGHINIARAAQSVRYPANFLLVAACNPCRCGFLGDASNRCQCSAASIESYKAKLSGPMLDRIDMHIQLPRVDVQTLQDDSVVGESSKLVRKRVVSARIRQRRRQKKLNSQLTVPQVERYCSLDMALRDFVEQACDRLYMSARGYHRVLKLARTIADINGSEGICEASIAEALAYRRLDRS